MEDNKEMTEEQKQQADYERERQKELELLRNSYLMYENTKKEALKVRKEKRNKDGEPVYSQESTDKTMALLETMQQDVVDKYLQMGGTMEDLKNHKASAKGKSLADKSKKLRELFEKYKNDETMGCSDLISGKDAAETEKEKEGKAKEQAVRELKEAGADFDPDSAGIIPLSTLSVQGDAAAAQEKPQTGNDGGVTLKVGSTNMSVSNAQGNKIKFDVIPLPSRGECYKSKISKVPVSYLTAYDENLIVSPNLYRDGLFVDYLLKTKLMTNEIDAGDMLPGDRDAMLLWLRASSYGPEYPISARDNETGEPFEAVVDLSQLSYRPFTLKGDANGYFDFTMPYSKDKIKFKFLTYNELKELDELETKENKMLKKDKLNEIANMLKDYADSDSDMDKKLRPRIGEAVKSIFDYAASFEEGEEQMFSTMVTNKLARSIVSVNGVTDRRYIEEDYIATLNIKDSTALRKYMTNNEPGIDFNITVEKPESLGGGSTNMFLTLDQFIFLNIAE